MKSFRKLFLLLAVQGLFIPAALAQAEPAEAGSGLVVVLGLAVVVLVVVVVFFAVRNSKAPRAPYRESKRPESFTSANAEPRRATAEPQREGQHIFISYRREDSADITGRI